MRRLLAAVACAFLLLGLSVSVAASPARASIQPTDGPCNIFTQKGQIKVVNGYIFQCQYIKGIGGIWVLVGVTTYHCRPLAPSRCT